MGYVLQSHVRALVVTDNTGRVLVRALIRLVLRSDTLEPVVFCDPMFFTLGYSVELQRELLYQVLRSPPPHAHDHASMSSALCDLPSSSCPQSIL